jgi:hypothetical protein
MHTSFFSYDLSRSYPFRWFTPVTILGGILFTVLFSIVNVASNGYQLRTIYTTDPNVTLSERHWFTKAPWSWTSRLQPTCESQNIQPGTQFFTNKLGLTYSLSRIWTGPSLTEATSTFPALTYLNNPLENCQVDYVTLEMQRASEASTPSAWWVWDASTASATGHCTVATDSGYVNASFSTAYPARTRGFEYVLEANYTEAASIWWGTRLSNAYWQSGLWAMASTNWTDAYFEESSSSVNWDTANIMFNVEDTSSIQSPSMFSIDYYFLDARGGIANVQLPQVSQYYNNESIPISAIMTEGQGFAKAFYSLMLVDLGQSTLSNLLLDEDNLQYALQAQTDIFRKNDNVWLPQTSQFSNLCGCDATTAAEVVRSQRCGDCDNFNRLRAPNDTYSNGSFYRMDGAYDLFKDQMGPLNTSQATIYSQYACSVPVRRGNGTVALAVILADLVLLSTVWKLYNLIAGWYLRRQDPLADACPRCLEMGDVLPLSDTKGSGFGGRPVALSRGTTGESSLALLHPPDAAWSHH